jgi:GDPmannose 4,6-dehydratase
VKKAFSFVGMELEFRGSGADEKGYITKCMQPDFQIDPGTCILEVDQRYFRPTEVEILLGDPTKAREKLGWETEYTLDDLVAEMMDADLKLMQQDRYLKDGGFKINNYYE